MTMVAATENGQGGKGGEDGEDHEGPLKLSLYSDAQTKFVKTLPLIANENAFLADVFAS